MLTYPTHSAYYRHVIKFNILSLSKIYLFSFGFVSRGNGHLQMTDSELITLVSSTSDIYVSFEDFLKHVIKDFLT